MATKSTLNSKLPKCGKPAIFTDISKGKSCTKAFCKSENGTYSVTIGCKQPSKKNYSYQVQWRCHFRYTAANAAKKGANWTSWTAWKTPVAIAAKGSLPAIPADSKANPDTWLRSNVGVNSKVTYKALFALANKSLGAYQAMAMQVRIRTFDAAKAKHGAWVNSDILVVFDRADVVDETLHAGTDGALDVDYNYIWDRSRKLHVTSVKDASGRELLKSAFVKAPQYDSYRSDQTPCRKRSGYAPGTSTIPLTSLKRAVQPNETLTYTAWLETGDGAKTYLTSPKTVIGEDASLGAPRVVVSTNENTGRAYVEVFKTDADDDLLSVGASVTWTYLGKSYTAKPSVSNVDTTVNSTTVPVAKFWFDSVPINTALTITVTFENHYRRTASTKQVVTILVGNYAILSGITHRSVVAAAIGNVEIGLSSEHSAIIERPFGRALPFAAIDATGIVNKVSFTAVVDETDTNPYACFKQWNTVRTSPGVYALRLPDGQMYRVAIATVDIGQTRFACRDVSFSATEVS